MSCKILICRGYRLFTILFTEAWQIPFPARSRYVNVPHAAKLIQPHKKIHEVHLFMA